MYHKIFSFLIILITTQTVFAQTANYSPLSTWKSPLSTWQAKRSFLETSSTQPSARPVIAGLRPVSIELLQDALIKKHPKLLRNNPRMARQVIVDKYLGKGSMRSRINGRNQLNGAMAEALFLKNNPDWKYVSKPNASQHDVYRNIAGKRPPLNGQIKFHNSGKPTFYARDMLKDHLAHRFFVPDDHVEDLRNLWLRRYESAKTRGDVLGAKLAARNAGRVQPMGVHSQEVVTGTKQSYQIAAVENRMVYASLAAGVALSLGQIGWNYAHGSLSADQAGYHTTKAITLIGAGVTADVTLALVSEGAIRGTLRGNLIVGAAVLLVETSWNIYEQGGVAAFRHPEFYEQLGGSISAIGIGGAAGFYSGLATTAAASETGPAAPFIGGAVGFIVGTGVGIIAYVGGRTSTRWLIINVWPEWYQQSIQQQINAARESIAQKISLAQAL